MAASEVQGREDREVDLETVARKIADEHHFQLVQYCGAGGYGQVWLALDHDGSRKALKIINIAKTTADVEREMRAVREYCRRVNEEPCMLTIYRHDVTDGCFWYLMQLADDAHAADGSYLADTLELRMFRNGNYKPDREFRDVISQVLDCVEVLHNAGLVHRDIKPSNVLFVKGRATLGDIGLLTDSRQVSLAGTRDVNVPWEMLVCQSNSIDGCMQDLYAVGCMMRSMLGFFDYSKTVRKDTPLPSGRMVRLINRLTLRACSSDQAQRYRRVADFRLDFNRCYGSSFHKKSRGVIMQIALALLVILGCLYVGRHWRTKPRRQKNRAEQAFDSNVRWFAESTRALPLWDVTYLGGSVNGATVSLEPARSGVAYTDGEFLCYVRDGNVSGKRGLFRIEIGKDLPRHFELVWLAAGTYSEVIEKIRFSDGQRDIGELAVAIRHGEYYALTGDDGETPQGDTTEAFSGVQRLIARGNEIIMFVDGMPVSRMSYDGSRSIRKITVDYVVSTSGEIHLSPMRAFSIAGD